MVSASDEVPILVTGAPRSGTTFLGRMLSLPHEIIYVYEPFNLEIGIEGIDRAFAYLDDTPGQRSQKYDALITELLSGRAQFKPNPLGRRPSLAKRLARQALGSRAQVAYKLAVANPRRRRYLIKDPMASFAAAYLHRRFGMQTVVLVRHPASTIASYKRLGWRYDLRELTLQSGLMERHLEPVLGGVNLATLTPLQEWCYLWLATYTVLNANLRSYPSMLMVRHEDLSLTPRRSFGELYNQLGLPFTEHIRAQLIRHTRPGNPVNPPKNAAHVLKRDSARNIDRWRTILSPAESHEIERITRPLAAKYYPSDHWW